MSCDYSNEKKLLTWSIFACIGFAVFGISVGLWAGSLIIVFDGAYSLVGLVLSVVALSATVYLQRSACNHQHQSHSGLVEAVVVLAKGLVIISVCGVSLISALDAIVQGGRDVNTGLALAIGAINVIGCCFTYFLLRRQMRGEPSDIFRAELKQWFMDTVMSLAVLCGFFVAYVMSYTALASYAVYADPIMVILVSSYFASVPLKMIQESSRKLAINYKDYTANKYAKITL